MMSFCLLNLQTYEKYDTVIVRNFKILALFKPLFSFYLLLQFFVPSVEPVCLVLQLCVQVVLHNLVVYLLCMFFSPVF